MTEGEKLKQIRKQLNLSQQEMAEALETGQQNISHIENGRIDSLNINILRNLVYNLGVNPYYVIGDEAKEPMFSKPDSAVRKKIKEYELLITKAKALLASFKM